MKQKIKEAITQGYKNLGVPESVVDGLAALGVTVVKDESEIAAFVQGEAVKGVMKSYQSETDKVRTEYSTKLKGLETEKAELEAKLNGNQPNPNPEPKPQSDEKVPAWAQVLIDSNKALSESNKALSEKLAGFEATKAKEAAVAALDKYVNDWDYAKGFPKEAAEAKRIAMKLYAKGGENMTAEELIAEFRGEFDPAVKTKGVTDFTKPFESDGGGGETDADFSSFERAAQKLGWTEPDK